MSARVGALWGLGVEKVSSGASKRVCFLTEDQRENPTEEDFSEKSAPVALHEPVELGSLVKSFPNPLSSPSWRSYPDLGNWKPQPKVCSLFSVGIFRGQFAWTTFDFGCPKLNANGESRNFE